MVAQDKLLGARHESAPASASTRARGFACATAAMLMPSLTRDALAADDSWTEVLRVSTGCIMNGDQPLRYSDGEPFTEGKNRGWPGDAGKAAYSFHPSAASHRGRWPYGCWFYLVKGAGVFVNVGRSLRAQTRASHVKKTEVGSGFGQLVARRLVQHRIASTAAPHASALLGHSAACAGRTHRPCFRPRRRDVHRQLGIPCEEREDPYCTRPPGDKLYCHLARQRGFDSIQIAQAHFNFRPEMIVCHGKCATAAVRTACPPIPLRSHANGRRPCKCDKRSALMNCGEAQVNCSFARPERAVLWHHACRTGLYERCINGSGSPSRLPV